VDNLNAIVILIPHEIYPKEIKEIKGKAKRIGGDDFTATKEVFMKAKNKHRIMRISNEYDAAELKGIISRCDLFIGARMHSVIAAISMGIPAIAIEYSHKAPGIMAIVGLDKYVCDFRTMSFDELTRKINSIWLHREEIKKDLVPRVETLKESVWFIGKIVKGLMDAVS
jgi:colanic acid/amylovoran biosynthesis protein